MPNKEIGKHDTSQMQTQPPRVKFAWTSRGKPI